ncbi:MAG TPA: acyl-CoA dehydrogenase family protein [Polyangiaceae bacterium]
MAFFQTPPTLAPAYTSDRVLRSYLARAFPKDALDAIAPQLTRAGELASGPLYETLMSDLRAEPKLTQWDAWGHRVDRIEITPLWQRMERVAAEEGLIATAYERRHGALSRLHQFALVYLLNPTTGVYSCPLAMTDGAAKTLLASGNQALIDRAVPRLNSRDPSLAWTSGQWMTERTGGSDVAICETVARHDPSDPANVFRLSGTKWFTSATTAQMSLTLGRPEGNPPGGSGLALFYLEVRSDDGALNGISIHRLKDKLGTRMVPTAELTLDGARATVVSGTTNGIKNITPMLAITRTWNAVCAVSGMRHAIQLARDYGQKRVAFGSALRDKPLHTDTLAGMQAEFEAAFHLTFRAVTLLGKEEAGEIGEDEAQLLRLITPLAKLTTGKQAVAVASEALEAFGGAGYIEDTGLPRLLRDAQVLPIWEGTTNVLALDVLRALGRGSLGPITREVRMCAERCDARLTAASESARRAVAHAEEWLEASRARGLDATEAGARRFALTLGRSLELALLIDHATWAAATEGDARPLAAARRFARHGVDLLAFEETLAESNALANDEPLS